MRAATGEPEAFTALPSAMQKAHDLWRGGQFESKKWEVMTTAVRHAIDDDILTVEEEDHLHSLGQLMGTPVQSIVTKNYQLFEEIAIAGINDGRFPELSHPQIMVKKGETAYASFNASLMKEMVIREFRGGTQSVSVPIGGGVRYRVGGMRGRSVVVGTEMVAQDSGVFVVTSQRAVFMGQSKTLEFRYDKLLGLEQFTDGLRLNVSNRQTASLLKIPQGPSVAAALISAASAV